MTTLRPERWMLEVVRWVRAASISASGDVTHGATLTASAARILRAQANVGDGTGRRLDEGTTILTAVQLQVGDVVWLPGESAASRDTGHVVTDVRRRVALDGTVTHYTSTLG